MKLGPLARELRLAQRELQQLVDVELLPKLNKLKWMMAAKDAELEWMKGLADGKKMSSATMTSTLARFADIARFMAAKDDLMAEVTQLNARAVQLRARIAQLQTDQTSQLQAQAQA